MTALACQAPPTHAPHTLLRASPPLTCLCAQAWGALATPGAGNGTITVKFFQDSNYATCGTTPLSSGSRMDGVCTLTFKVTAGSVMGVQGAGSCPAGTYSVKQGDGSASCIMPGPGHYVQGGEIKRCAGQSYSDEWGATQCKPCKAPYPPKQTWEGAPPEANYFCLEVGFRVSANTEAMDG